LIHDCIDFEINYLIRKIRADILIYRSSNQNSALKGIPDTNNSDVRVVYQDPSKGIIRLFFPPSGIELGSGLFGLGYMDSYIIWYAKVLKYCKFMKYDRFRNEL
jgi:hypothetical protein